MWSVGRAGNLTLYNQKNEIVDSLFYHAHALEKIGPDRFILFDNDYFNLTNLDPIGTIGTPRLVEIVVNETAGSAREVWDWKGDGEKYFAKSWGDADRLPNGNTLGTFGWGLTAERIIDHPAFITEVNHEGEIVWEMGFQHDPNYSWGLYRSERFLEKPIIKVDNPSVAFTEGSSVLVNVSTWNTIRVNYHENATLSIYKNSTKIKDIQFQFEPYWQQTSLQYNLKDLTAGTYNYTLVVTNNEGLASSVTVSVTVSVPDLSMASTTTSSTDEKVASNFGFTLPILIFLFASLVVIKRNKF